MIAGGLDGRAQAVAAAFVAARRDATPFHEFPGDVPRTLEDAYAIQRAAINQWSDRVAGWKVGRITGDLETDLGVNRFVGPIFAGTIMAASPSRECRFPVFADGFAALEVEIVAVIGRDQPAGQQTFSIAEARAEVTALHLGIEVAGSPLSSINDRGPLASIAGFGNNNGLIIGHRMAGGTSRGDDALAAVARIDGEVVGEGTAGRLPGGLWESVAFALGQASRLGLPLRAGDVVSTGALTGVHAVQAGQYCEADFGTDGLLRCITVAGGL